jgi:hypothetical protein
MGFMHRRPARLTRFTPTFGFSVLAVPPDEWPGSVTATLFAGADRQCHAVHLRYDLFGPGGTAMVIAQHRRDASAAAPSSRPALDQLLHDLGQPSGPEPLDQWQLLADITGISTPVRRENFSEARLDYAAFDWNGAWVVSVATWQRPITADLFRVLRLLPAEFFAPQV